MLCYLDLTRAKSKNRLERIAKHNKETVARLRSQSKMRLLRKHDSSFALTLFEESRPLRPNLLISRRSMANCFIITFRAASRS